MNFITVISTFYQLPARRTVARIAMVFAGLIWVAPQCVSASEQKESALPAAAKPASNSAAAGTPQKAEFVSIVARFVEFTDPAFAEVTAPGGALEKLRPAKAPANTVHVLAPEELESILRVLHRMKGVDLLNAPRVIAKSGQRNESEIAREIKYATEWVFDKKLQQHTPTAFEVKKQAS